jgi:hypothetical protein
MKHTIKIILALSLGAFAVQAQTALTATNTTALMTSSQNYIQLTSTTGIADKSLIYIIDIGDTLGELAQVRGACSSTQCTIVRNGQKVRAHASGAQVIISPTYSNNYAFGQAFQAADPAGAAGVVGTTPSCANTLYTPWVNYTTGSQWICSSQTNTWVAGWGPTNVNGYQVLSGTATASVAGTTVIAGPLVHISGTNAITAFQPSVGWNGQGFCVIPDAAFTTTTGGTTVASTRVIAIALGSTAVANKMLCFSYDAFNSKFVPSY